MGCLVIVVVTIMSPSLLHSSHNRLNIIDKLCVHYVCNALCGSKDKRERERKFCYVLLRGVLSLNISLKVCVRERLELFVSSSLRTTNSFVYNEAHVSSSSSSWEVRDGWCVCVRRMERESGKSVSDDDK